VSNPQRDPCCRNQSKMMEREEVKSKLGKLRKDTGSYLL